MPDDYSQSAIADRLEHAAEVYTNGGNTDSATAAQIAANEAREATPEAALQIERDFNAGNDDYTQIIEQWQSEGPDDQGPDDPGAGDPGAGGNAGGGGDAGGGDGGGGDGGGGDGGGGE